MTEFKPNPIFEQHYERYLEQISHVDLSQCESVLGLNVDHETKSVTIPFFNTLYRVSPSGVTDDRGESPDYGIRVIVLKYVLMCPRYIPSGKDWITFREFTDSGQARDDGLSVYATQALAKRYSGRLSCLKAAVDALDGHPPENDYPYDVSVVLTALPHLPLLFLFNDADEQFPAQASLLYERRAEHLLDAECRIMVDWYVLTFLKQAEESFTCG